MGRFDISEQLKQRPIIQLAPLVDIAFWALISFMVIAAFSQLESEVNIIVPKSTQAIEPEANAGKMVINVSRDGQFIINGEQLNDAGLLVMLKKISKLFPNQQVIIRADEFAYHKYVIQALDACMRSDISDISFSTLREETK